MSANEPTRSHETRPEQTADHLPNQTADHLDADTQPQFAEELPADSSTVIPGYEILGELGRGGMGVVFKARQLKLNRLVALKTMLRSDAIARARFLAEAEAVAAVKHPNIVQVYESGEHAGQPYLAMEFLSGGTLADFVASPGCKPGGSSVLLPLLAKIASGVAAAHEAGIVHRDLKPINVLFDEHGEPKVTDFGLAKRATSDLTRTQAVMGTPHYMAPEQATGAKFAGPPADVWALGVMLYECMTGGKPFTGSRIEEVLHKVVNTEPARPRAINPATPRDVELICLKCLEKHPADRYPSAKELAADLQHLVNGEPITLRPAGMAERLTKWAKRKPTAAAAYGFSMLAVALALVVYVIFGFWREAEGAKKEAETALGQLAGEQKLTVAARDEAIHLRGIADAGRIEEGRLRGIADKALLGEAAAKKQVEREREKLAAFEYAKAVQLAYRVWQNNDTAGALALLDDTRADLRGWEWDYVRHVCNPQLAVWGKSAGPVGPASWNPDGSRVVIGSYDGTPRVWNPTTGKELAALRGHTGHVELASWNPDGTKIVTAGGDATARVWDATGKELSSTGKELSSLDGPSGSVNSASWNPDGTNILTVSTDGTARVRDPNGKELTVLRGGSKPLRSASWSPDGTKLLTSSDDRTARVWDVSRKGFTVLKGHTASVDTATWSPDGTKLFTASSDKTARIWDATTGKEVAVIKGFDDLGKPSWSPDGTRVVAGTVPGPVIRIWDVTGKEIAVPKSAGDMLSFGWSPDGARLVTFHIDGTIRVWDTAWKEITTFKGHSGDAESWSWSPDGTMLFTTSDDGTGRVRDTTGRELAVLRGHMGRIHKASWSPDGTKILTYSKKTSSDGDGTRRVWDAAGKELAVLQDQTPYSASWSPDGSRIVMFDNRNRVTRVWEAATGKELLVMRHARHVPFRDLWSAEWSPDGTRLVILMESSIVVWDAWTGAEMLTLDRHTMTANFVSWSPDGSRILVANRDGTIRIWDSHPIPIAPMPRLKLKP